MLISGRVSNAYVLSHEMRNHTCDYANCNCLCLCYVDYHISRMSDYAPTAAANRTVRRQLDALRSTLADDSDVALFNLAVDVFQHLDNVFAKLTLGTLLSAAECGQ